MESKPIHFIMLSLFLLLLALPSTSAFSLTDIVDQIQSYIPSALQAPLNNPAAPAYPEDPSASPPQTLAKAATFPCCICSGCTCSHTSCPRIIPRPGEPPEASWPIESGTPKLVASAGCGAKYGPDACLLFVQQYLAALQPALETASKNHSHGGDGYEKVEAEKKKKKKQPCCGEGCSDAQCLGYLAVAVKDLQAPINGTLESSTDDSRDVSGTEGKEAAKSEL